MAIDPARILGRSLLLLVLALYTAFAAGPFAWLAVMSLRTSTEISADPYALPETFHFQKFAQAWTGSNYDTYFWNSSVVTVASVTMLCVFGAMAAHALARYRFPFNRLVFFLIFSAIILPPQITIIGVFQLMVQYGL